MFISAPLIPLNSESERILSISGFCVLILNCSYNLEEICTAVCVEEDLVISTGFCSHTVTTSRLCVRQLCLGAGSKAVRSIPSQYLQARQERDALTPVTAVMHDLQLQGRALLGKLGLLQIFSPELWLETVMVAAVYCKKAIWSDCGKSK